MLVTLHLLIKMTFRSVELILIILISAVLPHEHTNCWPITRCLSWSRCTLAARLNIIVPSETHPVMLVMNTFPVRTQVRVTPDSSFSTGMDHLTIFLSLPLSHKSLIFSYHSFHVWCRQRHVLSFADFNNSNLNPFSPHCTVSSTSPVLFYHRTQQPRLDAFLSRRDIM